MLTVIFTLVFVGQPAKESRDAGAINARCGGYCLYVALRAVGVPLGGYEQLEQRIGAPGPDGYSLAELSDGARSFGLDCYGERTSLDRLARWPGNFTCIGLMKGHVKYHYVLIFDIDKTSVCYIDYPHSYRTSRDVFVHNWTGNALIIGKPPLARPPAIGGITLAAALTSLLIVLGGAMLAGRSIRRRITVRRSAIGDVLKIAVGFGLVGLPGCVRRHTEPSLHHVGSPRLLVNPTHVGFGDVRPSADDSLTATLRITNGGPSKLVIHGIRASCGCTVPQIDHARIDPAGAMDLRVYIRPGLNRGDRSSRLAILSNDPDRPLVEIPITWSVRPSLYADPAYIDLGRMVRGTQQASSFRLIGVDPASLNDIEIHCSSRKLTVATAVASSDSNGGRCSRLVTVSLTPECVVRPGDYMEAISIKSNRLRIPICVPVHWHVSPEVYVSPTTVFLGNVAPGSSVSASLLVSYSDKSAAVTQITVFGERDDIIASEMSTSRDHPTVDTIAVSFRAPGKRGYARFRLAMIVRSRGRYHDVSVDCSMNVKQRFNQWVRTCFGLQDTVLHQTTTQRHRVGLDAGFRTRR
jgi:hypothetical protein